MAQIKHIALATQDAEATARFYIEVFGLKEVAKLDIPDAKGYFLSDGAVNLAILDFRSGRLAGAEYGQRYSGIHHIGFEVESLEEIAQKLQAANAQPRDDINQVFQAAGSEPRKGNVEVKYGGPDGVIIDISETGWVGTRGWTD